MALAQQEIKKENIMSKIPMFLKPNEVKVHIGISPKTLRKLKDSVFLKGKHYFIPPGLIHPVWSRDALLSWIQQDGSSEAEIMADDILHNL